MSINMEQYIALLTLAGIMVFLLREVIRQKIRIQTEKEKEYRLYDRAGNRVKQKKDVYITLYRILTGWALTRKYITRIKKRTDIFYPADNRNSAVKAVKIFLRTMVVLGIIFITNCILRVNLYSILICLYFAYVTTDQVHFRFYRNEKYRLEKDFDNFLSWMMNNFFTSSLADAMEEGAEQSSARLRAHLNLMAEAIKDESMGAESKIRRYSLNSPFRVMKDFFVLACTVNRFGDKKINDESMLLKNIGDLQDELREDMLHQDKEKYMSTGWAAMVSVPLVSLPFIEKWGIYCMPVLGDFYQGRVGILVMLFIFFSAFIIYNTLMSLLTDYEFRQNGNLLLTRTAGIPFVKEFLEGQALKNYGRTLRWKDLLKRSREDITPQMLQLRKIMYSMGTFLALLLTVLILHGAMKYRYLDGTGQESGIITSSINPQKEKVIKDLVEQYTRPAYHNWEITREIPAPSPVILEAVVSEIGRRVAAAENEYLRWYEFIVCLAAAYGAFYVPEILLKGKRKKIERLLREEVIELQSVTVMLATIPSIGWKELLCWMESVSVILRPSLQECISRLDMDSEGAVRWLKEEEKYQPFQNLLSKMAVMDQVGIRQAFSELREERRYSRKRKLQENQKSIEQKGEGGGVLAFIPIMLIVMLYIVAPFMYQALTGYSSIMGEFNA